MASQNGVQSTELLNAQAHVWNHIFNFINSMSLKCAVQLGILDIIHEYGKPMTLEELVDALHINKAKVNGVYHLMRIFTHSGFFVKEKISGDEEKKGYRLTPSSRLLLKDEPYSVAPLLLAMLDPIFRETFQKKERLAPFEVAHGRTFWEYLKN
ncbi:O-methyltransferase family protein [Forsythia ovata]|uniref:O-methyltransferase family protein n=1 Tax=Forsythia ovata TaxID=205694 RepID=A0ABD1R4M8_9LAMI